MDIFRNRSETRFHSRNPESSLLDPKKCKSPNLLALKYQEDNLPKLQLPIIPSIVIQSVPIFKKIIPKLTKEE